MAKPVKVVHADVITNKKNAKVERLVLDVGGTKIQVNRYNEDNDKVVLAVSNQRIKTSLEDADVAIAKLVDED